MKYLPAVKSLPALPKKLQKALILGAVLTAGAGLISAAMQSVTMLRINQVLSQMQRTLPKLEQCCDLYLQQNGIPSQKKKFRKAQSSQRP